MRVLFLMSASTYKAESFLRAASVLQLNIVVGTERQQTLSPLAPQANLTLPFDDPDAAVLIILEFHKRTPIDSVLAVDDDGALIAARASEILGLASNPPAAICLAQDKAASRRAWEKVLPTPAFWTFAMDEALDHMTSRVEYPCVLKPVALSGSRGVIRANNDQEFSEARDRIASILSSDLLSESSQESSAQRLLVESYIPGSEYALEGLLSDGQLQVLALFDKPDPLQGPFFEETIYTTPSRAPSSVQQTLVETVETAVETLGLREGPVHAEIRIHEGRGFILELAPRCIGGYCSRVLRFDPGGISLEEVLLRGCMGQRTTAFRREPMAAGVMMIPIPQAGILNRVGGVEAAKDVPDIEEIRLTIPCGQRVLPVPEGRRYLGFIFSRAATPLKVERALRQSHARLEISIESLDPLECESK